MRPLYLIVLISSFLSCKQDTKSSKTTQKEKVEQRALPQKYISQCNSSIEIDGVAKERSWAQADWQPIDQVWLGAPMTDLDFSGRYKTLWNEDYLYILAEIQDDTLIDIHADGLDSYWDDDCLEIFVDEDRSKGNHQYTHNAFAYHISLEGETVDMGTDSFPRYYNHILSNRITKGNTTIWEVAMKIFPDSYKDGVDSKSSRLHSGKRMGFAIAYCDNDHSAERENFIGSVKVEGEDKNRGWIDAGIFEEVVLK